MSKLPVSLFGATLALACAAMFAGAQPAPKRPAPASAAETVAPATPAPPPSCPHCDAKQAGASDAKCRGGHMDAAMCAKHQGHVRTAEIAKLANIEVQTTKLGAAIQLTAKNAADVAKVQQVAKDFAAHLTDATPHSHHAH